MRFRLLTAALVPLAAVALFAVPVTADEAEDPCRPFENSAGEEVELCEERYYLQCAGTVGGKVNAVPPVVNTNAQLTTQAPAGSFTAGEGCGEVENSNSSGVSQDNIHDFTFEGYVDGQLDSLAVELHDFSFSPNRMETDPIPLGIRVAIDDRSPFGTETITTGTGTYEPPRMIEIQVPPQLSSTGASVKYEFTLTDLDEILGTAGVKTTDHFVKITVDTPTDGAHAFIWGATEIPSGVTTNPAEPVGTVVPATG